MKLSVKPDLLKLFTMAVGALGLLLRTVLYATGMDEKGLLIDGHWAGTALCILTAAVIAGLFLLTRSIQGPEDYETSHPASFLAGLGAMAAAIAIVGSTAGELRIQALPLTALSFAAALCLIVIGVSRMKGTKPTFLCHAVLCVFFAMRMVSQYQHWNSDPQLQDYVFYLSAYVALMLTAYQQAAFDMDMGSHKNLWCLSLTALYLCIVSLKDGVDTWLLLGGAIWALTNLTELKVHPRRQRPQLNLEEE